MIVIKYGGHALPIVSERDEMLEVIADHHLAGKQVVVVHGGGPQIDSELALHGIAKNMVSGYRFTSPEVFEVVQQVLSGRVLRTLVNQLNGLGASSVGITAADGKTIVAKRMFPIVDGKAVDIGLVGDIEHVDPALLQILLDQKYLPVVSPVAADLGGHGLNLNADLAAGAIGGALQADEVIFMTDVAGIYRNWPDPESVIKNISAQDLTSLQPTFSDGMIPKVKAALFALASGATQVRIIDGRDPKKLQAALAGEGGTVITK